MDIAHETLVAFAKSWGLFYLIGLALAVVVYTFWPGNRDRFKRAKHSILDDDDRPADPPGDDRGEQPEEQPREQPGGQPCR